MSIGILAFGSLISDPKKEIRDLIERRIKTETPFGVEFARLSSYRKEAPTLVPFQKGKPVNAEIFLLKNTITIQEAKDILYRREIDKVGDLSKKYVEKENPPKNKVLIPLLRNHKGINEVIYTDFPEEGKLSNPDPKVLAEKAIHSVKHADIGKDGISYLIDAINNGIETVLTNQYKNEILSALNVDSLEAALDIAK